MKQLIYLPVKGFKNLGISVCGQPYDLKKKQPIKVITRHGYRAIRAKNSKNGNLTTVYLQQLVANTWLQNPKGRKYIRFIDGNFENVHGNNLYWDDVPADDALPVHLSEFAPYYQITPNRQIWSERIKAFMSPSLGSKGYPSVWLRGENGKKLWQQVHRLAGFAFVPNDDPQNKTVCHHIDGNRKNFAASNLIWVRPSTNVKEGWRMGREKKTGSKSSWFKGLYEYDSFIAESIREMAEHLKMTISNVKNMVRDGSIKFTPENRLPERTDLPKKILQRLNKRWQSKSKQR